MKAIQISRTGGSDVLELVDVPDPVPGPGEVLVEAAAIGVNYFDLLIRTGRYRWMPALPFVLGNEMSGRVAALGSGVTKLKVGQRVFIAGYEIGNRGGLYAQYAAVPEDAACAAAGFDRRRRGDRADQLSARAYSAASRRARREAGNRGGLWRGGRRRLGADRCGAPRRRRR